MLTSADRRRPKHHLGGAELGTGNLGVADRGRRADAGQVLALQPRIPAPSSDVDDPDRLAGHQREAERRAEDLPAALSEVAIDGQHRITPSRT